MRLHLQLTLLYVVTAMTEQALYKKQANLIDQAQPSQPIYST
jgi:hypothetical protein